MSYVISNAPLRQSIPTQRPLMDTQCKDRMLAIILQNSKAFGAVRAVLKPEHFGEFNPVFRLLWQLVLEYHATHGELPEGDFLLPEIEEALNNTPSMLTPAEVVELNGFIDWAYDHGSFKQDIAESEQYAKWAIEKARRFLEEQITTRARASMMSGSHVVADLSTFTSNLQQELTDLRDAIGDDETFTDAEADAADVDIDAPLVVELLREREVAMLTGGSKTCKSWLAISLAQAAVVGGEWLGFKIQRPLKVLYIDGECKEVSVTLRLRHVRKGMGITGGSPHLCRHHYRGKTADIDTIARTIPPGAYDLIIIDPIYKFWPLSSRLGGRASEIEDAAMNAAMDSVFHLCQRSGASILLIHHTTKGKQSGKRNTDAPSGSGVLVRAPDSVWSILPEENDPYSATFRADLRDHPAIDPIPVTRTKEQPIWTRCSVGKDGVPEKSNADDVLAMRLATVAVTAEYRSKGRILSAAINAIQDNDGEKLSMRRAEHLFHLALDSGNIHLDPKAPKNRPTYRRETTREEEIRGQRTAADEAAAREKSTAGPIKVSP